MMRFIKPQETLPVVIPDSKGEKQLMIVEDVPIELKFIASIPSKPAGVTELADTRDIGSKVDLFA